MKAKKDPRNRVRKLIRNWAVPIGCGLLFLFLLNFAFFIGFVPTASMEPTIMEGSFIFGVRITGELKQGDIIIFEREGRLLVKRIAGAPGDTVVIGADFLTVPDGCYYVLGDNAKASQDSRYWAEPFVPQESIIAKLWPQR